MKKLLLFLFAVSISTLAMAQGPGVYPIKADTVRIKKTISPTAGFVLTAINTSGDGIWKQGTSILNPDSLAKYSWSRLGNAGTNPAVNFIGTTDKDTLMFKLNGNAFGIFDRANKNIALGCSTLILSNTTGNFNSAFGFNSLWKNTTGSYNTGIGYEALKFNTAGSFNVALGYDGLLSNTTGSNLIAIGNAVDVDLDGLQNSVGIGYNAHITQDNQFSISDTLTSYHMRINGGGVNTILANDGTGSATWQNHIGSPSNHLLYAYIDTVHTLAGSVWIGQYVHLTATNDQLNVDTVNAGKLMTTFGGDLTGSISNSVTVAKLNGVAAAQYLTNADTASKLVTQSSYNTKQPYTSYQAIVTQTSTSNPSAVVLANNIGATITWARTSAGVYTATASGAVFTAGKTVVLISQPTATLVSYIYANTSTSVITFTTGLLAVGVAVPTDALLLNTLIEIRIYN